MTHLPHGHDPRVEISPAAELGAEALARVFTAGYEGYWVPVELDGAAFTRMAAVVDADLGLSRVGTVAGTPVAIVVLARREAEGWVGGMAVTAPHRRRGIGATVLVAALDAARAAGIERITLEVLDQNHPARRLYERLGFRRVRDLEVWTLPTGPGEPHEVDAAVAHAWLRAHRADREPWQRDDASVGKLEEVRGLMLEDAAALVRVAGGHVSVLQLAGRREALRELLVGARALGESVRVVNLPDTHPASAVLAELGGRVDARQHELELRLSRPGPPSVARAARADARCYVVGDEAEPLVRRVAERLVP
jgi:GNAT superfamily N-acetyltransferase